MSKAITVKDIRELYGNQILIVGSQINKETFYCYSERNLHKVSKYWFNVVYLPLVINNSPVYITREKDIVTQLLINI